MDFETTFDTRTIIDLPEAKDEQSRITRVAKHARTEAIKIKTADPEIQNLIECIISTIKKSPNMPFGYRENDSGIEILLPWFKGRSPVEQMSATDLGNKYPEFKNISGISGNVLVFEINPHNNPVANNLIMNMASRIRKLTPTNPKYGFLTKGNGYYYRKGSFGANGKKIIVAIAIA